MKPIEPNGIKRKVSFSLLKKMLFQSKSQSKERMTTFLKKLSVLKNRTRETNGSTISHKTWVRWKLIIKCCMVLVAVYSIDSILEELVKVFQNQMVQVSQPAKTLVMEQAELVMELIRVWTTLSLDSNLNLVAN